MTFKPILSRLVGLGLADICMAAVDNLFFEPFPDETRLQAVIAGLVTWLVVLVPIVVCLEAVRYFVRSSAKLESSIAGAIIGLALGAVAYAAFSIVFLWGRYELHGLLVGCIGGVIYSLAMWRVPIRATRHSTGESR